MPPIPIFLLPPRINYLFSSDYRKFQVNNGNSLTCHLDLSSLKRVIYAKNENHALEYSFQTWKVPH